MTTETLTKEQAKAIEFFEQKLAFEIGPIALKYALAANEPITVVDLRTPELYAKSHIPGAINLSYEDLEKSTAALSKDKTTVVHCYGITCALSTKAALLLAKKGYPVKELYGNFDEYAAAQLPLEGTEVKAASCGGNCS